MMATKRFYLLFDNSISVAQFPLTHCRWIDGTNTNYQQHIDDRQRKITNDFTLSKIFFSLPFHRELGCVCFYLAWKIAWNCYKGFPSYFSLFVCTFHIFTAMFTHFSRVTKTKTKTKKWKKDGKTKKGCLYGSGTEK